MDVKSHSIEQSELHIHPAVQVGLGDLFIECINQNPDLPEFAPALLIETHSEHLMLRLFKRIKETIQGDIPPGKIGLSKNDVSIIVIDVENKKFKNMPISEDGEVYEKWPGGFFEERAEELF